MNVVVSHPTGNRNVRQVITSLNEAGLLCKFYTTISARPTDLWLRCLPKKISLEILRRSYQLPEDKIETDPLLEITRMFLPKIGLKKFTKHEIGIASVDSVYKRLDRKLANDLPKLVTHNNVDAVYAYEDGALESFSRAKKLGIKCIYDLPIAYWETGRKLMFEEAERLPEWAVTLGGGIKDSQQKLDRKTREMELADVVIGPGNFVIDSLPEWACNKKIIISAFGSPVAPDHENKVEENKSEGRPLRVLFVGSMGQRKGLGDLFAAMRLLATAPIELVVMGSLLAPLDFYKKKLPNFTYEPGRPHQEVLALMRSCDVFCLPSIVEGRALVMQEAMSQGLPLIITPNTGGADLIKEGSTGFLVPIRSPEVISEKLTWFLNNRSHVKQMGMMARQHAKKYTWDKYGNHIVESLSRL